MPFGIGKKGGGGDDDSNRNALFGSRKKADGLPSKPNPYAQQNADPYANAGPAPPPYQGGSGNEYRDNKSPSAFAPGPGQRQSPYGGLPSRGPAPAVGNDRYGGSGNYGSASGYGNQDRYGAGQSAQPVRQGGYGGLGRTTSQDTMSTDAGRNELFGGAAQRYEQQQQQQKPSGAYGQQQSGAYGDSGYGSQGGYGSGPSYDSRELTQEEQEEEDVAASKSEIKFMKQQDVASTRNALRLAQQAEETGRDTLARLGAQGERIHNTERNLDLASNQNRIAEEKARELKTLNRSMFAVHVGNPFTSKSRAAERDMKVMETHRSEREQRDASRKAAWETQARGSAFNQQMAATTGSGQKSTLADRAKYQFEADSEDDEMENEIDSNLDQLHGAARRLNALGRAMGEEVDTQNKHIDRIIGKTDKVDDQIAMNRARLDRIH